MNPCQELEESLSRYATGELDPGDRAGIERHLAACEGCRGVLARFEDLGRATRDLTGPVLDPGASRRILARIRTELEARAALAGDQDVMTLDEVARFLRVDPEDLEAELDDLPVFEVAGRLRVRRERLLEWVARRELRTSVANRSSPARRRGPG